GALQGARHREAEQHGSETVDLGEGAGGAGDDHGVETEKKAAEGGDDGAFEEVSVHGLVDAGSAWHGIPHHGGSQCGCFDAGVSNDIMRTPERWQSGRSHPPRKRAYLDGYREFESPPLRQPLQMPVFGHAGLMPAPRTLCFWRPRG